MKGLSGGETGEVDGARGEGKKAINKAGKRE